MTRHGFAAPTARQCAGAACNSVRVGQAGAKPVSENPSRCLCPPAHGPTRKRKVVSSIHWCAQTVPHTLCTLVWCLMCRWHCCVRCVLRGYTQWRSHLWTDFRYVQAALSAWLLTHNCACKYIATQMRRVCNSACTRHRRASGRAYVCVCVCACHRVVRRRPSSSVWCAAMTKARWASSATDAG